MTVKSYCPDTNFGYVTLILEIWPWIQVMTNPLVIKIHYGSEELLPWHDWRGDVCIHCDLGDDIAVKFVDTPGSWKTIVWNIQVGQVVQKLWPG